ncbi:MAG: ABC transporter ATP-binding protein, partial [Alphaproteobacteria bacterium]|nr:ABC transporter ATP-binding protein [Alphaproteobacteria bacterium]
MSTPSVISAVQKLRSLLTPKEKREWLSFVGIALISSALEIVTASVIVVFAQVINQPELGMKYIVKAGLEGYVRSDQVVLYLAILFGLIYLVKNMISAFEAFFQNFSIQRMNYNFKKEMLKRYTYMDYSLYLTRNSSFGMTVVGGDIEKVYSTGMPALAAVISEGVVFVCLVGMIVFMDPSLFGFIFGIGGFVGFCIYKWFLPMFYNWGKHLQETALLSTKNLLQFFHAFKEILLLGKQDTFIEVYHRISQKRSRIQAVQTATNTLPRVVIEVLFVGLFVLTISYMSVNYDQPQQMLGMLGGYLYVGFRVMPGLNRIIGQLNNFKTVIPSVERMDQEYSTAFSKENYVNVPGLKFE